MTITSSSSLSNQLVHVIVDQSSLSSGLRNELMNNVLDSLKEWAIKVSLVSRGKVRLLFSFLKINSKMIIEELIPVDELSLSSVVRTMKSSNDSDQASKSKYLLSNSLSTLNSFLDNYMVSDSESTQIIFFTMNQLSKEEPLEEVFRKMYNDNKDMHIVKVIHDFEEEVIINQEIIKCVENYPNIRISSIFNDPICITRELFQATKYLLKNEIGRVRLFLKSEDEPLNLSILSNGSSTCLNLGMKDRLCLCHNERVNSNLYHQTLSRGFICSKSLKLIDHNDTVPALLLNGSSENQMILQINDESISEMVSESIDIQVISKVHLSSVTYELLFEKPFVLIPFTDISFDIHDLERNEGNLASLCTSMSEGKYGLVCNSTSNLDSTSIKGSGILYHFLVFPDSQCRCLYIQQLSTSDEILPPVHIPVMIYSSDEQLYTMKQKLNDLETIEDFNPLHLSSKKLEFVYRSIKGVNQVKKPYKELTTKPQVATPMKKVENRPPQKVVQINNINTSNQTSEKKNYKQLVKKIVFK